MVLGVSDAEMAAKQNASGSAESDQSSLTEQPSSRSFNRSVRVAEKERRNAEAEDPFVPALKYFSDGRRRPGCSQTNS